MRSVVTVQEHCNSSQHVLDVSVVRLETVHECCRTCEIEAKALHTLALVVDDDLRPKAARQNDTTAGLTPGQKDAHADTTCCLIMNLNHQPQSVLIVTRLNSKQGWMADY